MNLAYQIKEISGRKTTLQGAKEKIIDLIRNEAEKGKYWLNIQTGILYNEYRLEQSDIDTLWNYLESEGFELTYNKPSGQFYSWTISWGNAYD